MPSPPSFLVHVETPTEAPGASEFYLQGWVAAQFPITAVRVGGDAAGSDMPLMPRPDVTKAVRLFPHAVGFGGRVPGTCVDQGQLALEVISTAGTLSWRHAFDAHRPTERPAAVPRYACPSCGSLLQGDPGECGRCQIVHTVAAPSAGQAHEWQCTPAATAATQRLLATHSHEQLTAKYLAGKGVEIGAFLSPLPGISPIYVDRFAEYSGKKTNAEYYGDACDLPFRDSSLDYVATSHVLEHVANPFAAWREWFRVLRDGGMFYMVVPDRRLAFDHDRPLTPATHLLDDFRGNVGQCDPTHITDFVFGVDWSLFSPETPPAQESEARVFLASGYEAAVENHEEISIHFHTFEMASILEAIELGNRERLWPGTVSVVECRYAFPASRPDGLLVVARVRKSFRDRLRTLGRKKGLRPDAVKFGAP